MIECKDSLEYLKERADYEFDINYSDPPYALGSEVIIRPDGKVDYKKANDFMNKWTMPTGEYWEQWFKEAYRTLKHGGYLIMFGMDRQLLLFKYYANLAGFTEQQSLYWYFISNFPKATDLSKQIDKNAGAEREKIENPLSKKQTGQSGTTGLNDKSAVNFIEPNPSTDLAKKYAGYKYSISPLKQTNETIMVFQKPYKTGSCLHDVLAKENGDETISGNCLDIDGNRVGYVENDDSRITKEYVWKSKANKFGEATQTEDREGWNLDGRYPSQTFCDSNTAEVLDKQSGVSGGGSAIRNNKKGPYTSNISWQTSNTPAQVGVGYTDTGGCSKILHKCDFEDHDLYFYNPKVSKSERNAGCDEFEDQKFRALREGKTNDLLDKFISKVPVKNNHPTLKPIKLNERILKLFKTPNEQKIIYPFAGSFSEVIGGYKAGFKDFVGCEINQEYIEIGNARLEYWTTQNEQVSLFDEEM
jgi:DNA modification methylase